MSQVQATARLGSKELTALLTLFVTTNAFMNYPQYVVKAGLEAAWMEPIFSGVLTIGIFMAVERLLHRYFPGLDIVEVAKERFGRIVAIFVALIFGAYFLFRTADVMRLFTENVALTVLPTTPISIISLVFILTIGYVAYCGLEGIARISYIWLPILVIGMVTLCLLTINWWHPLFLTPLWGAGQMRVFIGSIRYASVFANVLLLVLIYPHAHDPKTLRGAGLVSILISMVLLAGFIVTFLMVFPADETVKVPFPMYQVARLIHIGRFIQRFESIFVFLWVVAAVIHMSMTLWGAAYVFSSAFGWPTFRPALPALALISLSLSVLPRNQVQVQQIDDVWFLQWGGIIVFGIPVAVLLAAILKQGLRRAGARRA